MKTKILNTTCSILMLVFLSAFGFQDNPPPSGWYQQFMPDLGRPLTDITFTDSLTGYAILSTGSSNDTNYIMKTSDGGDNWNVSHVENKILRRIIFLNNDTGYVAAQVGFTTYILRTINGGNEWVNHNVLSNVSIIDMHVLNTDTIWAIDKNIPAYRILRTTNGGALWTIQLQQTSPIFDKIYMFNSEVGFVGGTSASNFFMKTSNSGINWVQIPGQNGFRDIFFKDSLTGWKTAPIKKTTDGGLTWVNQSLPFAQPGVTIGGGILNFSYLNTDTLWGVGGHITYSNNQTRGLVYRTTNGGNNWLYQVPDTNMNMYVYYYSQFINPKIGWAYRTSPTGIHTKTGGDTTFYTGIVSISNEVPSDFMLHQNYPNPFNPRTVIRYALTKSANVTLKVFDVTGREYTTLVNDFQRAGVYEVDFMGKFSASGVYFYRLSVGDFSETKRMLLVK